MRRRARARIDTRVQPFLSKLKVKSKGAQRHYTRSVTSFRKWCSEWGLMEALSTDPCSQQVDESMEKYMDNFYKSRRPVTDA